MYLLINDRVWPCCHLLMSVDYTKHQDHCTTHWIHWKVSIINQWVWFIYPCVVVRNSLGSDLIFVHKLSKLYAFARTLYEETPGGLPGEKVKPCSDLQQLLVIIVKFSLSLQAGLVLINPDSSGGVSGSVWPNNNMADILKKEW